MLNTTEILQARDTYRAAVTKFVDDNFHYFKCRIPSFREMLHRVDDTAEKEITRNKHFFVRAETILRHEYSNYDSLLKAMPTKECGERFKYLVRKRLRALAKANYWQQITDELENAA